MVIAFCFATKRNNCDSVSRLVRGKGSQILQPALVPIEVNFRGKHAQNCIFAENQPDL